MMRLHLQRQSISAIGRKIKLENFRMGYYNILNYFKKIMVVAAFLGMSVNAQAEPGKADQNAQGSSEIFKAGVHYTELKFPVKPETADKIEVMEVFSYGCIHCFNFEPLIQGWKANKAEDVKFDRTPAIFNERWEVYARAYYAAKALGQLDVVHQPLFDALHQQRKQITGKKTLASFMRSLGISEEDFNKTYDSFSVSSNINKAQARQRGYRVTGVPTMVVNGKYVISARQAGSAGKVLEVVDYLVNKERQAKTESDSKKASD